MYNITDEYFEVFKKNNLSFLKDNIFFRDIKLKNVQILKMISFLVRDKNWNNYSPLIKNKNLLNNDKHFTFIFDLEFGHLEKFNTINEFVFGENYITLKSNGKFITDFWTNRIGFNLLIPLKYHVGSKIKIEKENNITEESLFPVIISPDQPFYKFSKLSYNINNDLLVKITFKGINFEMEDQRNWGDASYKIYSGSLLDPFPYKQIKNSNFFQEIKISYTQKKPFSIIKENNLIEIINDKEFKMPNIGIKINHLNELNENFRLNFNFVYYVYDTTDINKYKNNLLSDKLIYLVALIDHNNDPEIELNKIEKFILNNNINLDKILICPKIYLGSFQPSGNWPKVPKLSTYYDLARKKFPNSEIISGMVTNFTELNRKRPDDYFDAVNFSFTPIVHDASDFGVLDTIETIPHILKSINEISKNKPIHVGPITLAMHYNPYGESIINNQKNKILEMSDRDPRHDSLLGLNWTTGIFIKLIDSSTKYLTFNTLFGFNGIISNNKLNKRPLFPLNELSIYFKNFKIKKIKYIKEINGLFLYNNNSKYILLVNNSKNNLKINLEKFIVKKISKINLDNHLKLMEGDFSFLNLQKYDFDDIMKPLEIRLLEIE